jgi:hypothetical protein
MNDLETLVAEAHADLVAAGHGWAQVRRLTETEKLDAVKLPHEWISAQAEKTDGGKKIVRIRSLDKLAIRFASAEMTCNRLK